MSPERENGPFPSGVDDVGSRDRLEVDMFVGVLTGVDSREELPPLWSPCLLR